MPMRWRRMLACAVALAALAGLGHAQLQCNTVQIGNVTDDVFALDEQRMESDMITLEVNVPDVCLDSVPVGLKVHACDSKQAPRLFLVDTTRGLVVREGTTDTAAYVYITVFCSDNSAESSTESTESPILISLPSTGSSESLSSNTEESSPKMHLESRFSAVPQDSFLSQMPSNVPMPMGLPSRFNDYSMPPLQLPASLQDLSSRWMQLGPPSLGRLNNPALASRWKEKEPLSSSKLKLPTKYPGKLMPKKYDSHSLYQDELQPGYGNPKWFKRPPSSLPSLAKRFSGPWAEQTSPWLSTRASAGLTQQSNPLASSWLNQRAIARATRRALSRRAQPASTYDDNDLWQYEEDPLSLHWSEERAIDPYPLGVEPAPLLHVNDNTQWSDNSKHLEKSAHIQPPSKRHLPHKAHYRFPSYKEDSSLPTAHKEQSLSSQWQKRVIPKLLLLLQEQDHPSTKHKCASAHTVDEGEVVDDAWHPEYPSEYSADDGDWDTRYADDSELSYRPKYHNQALILPKEDLLSLSDWSDRSMITGPISHSAVDYTPPGCPKCPSIPTRDDVNPFLQQHLPPRYSKAPAVSGYYPPAAIDPYSHYASELNTERPASASTIRNSLSWIKTSKAPSVLKKTGPVAAEQQENIDSASPWNFLSKLLLSHPTFRDSTHVIRL